MAVCTGRDGLNFTGTIFQFFLNFHFRLFSIERKGQGVNNSSNRLINRFRNYLIPFWVGIFNYNLSFPSVCATGLKPFLCQMSEYQCPVQIKVIRISLYSETCRRCHSCRSFTSFARPFTPLEPSISPRNSAWGTVWGTINHDARNLILKENPTVNMSQIPRKYFNVWQC